MADKKNETTTVSIPKNQDIGPKPGMTQAEFEEENKRMFNLACKVAGVPEPPADMYEQMLEQISLAAALTSLRGLEEGTTHPIVLIMAQHIRTMFGVALVDSVRQEAKRPSGPAGYL